MAIFVYNREKEMFDGENNYRIYRPYLLGNPYTHIRNRETKAMYIVGSREEAVQKYSHYFDVMYQTNLDFRDVVDEMYEKYKNGEDIYLECYCKKYLCKDMAPHKDEVSCHGDIIKSKLEQRLLKEKITNLKNKTEV
jgi:hypothetical protein